MEAARIGLAIHPHGAEQTQMCGLEWIYLHKVIPLARELEMSVVSKSRRKAMLCLGWAGTVWVGHTEQVFSDLFI